MTASVVIDLLSGRAERRMIASMTANDLLVSESFGFMFTHEYSTRFMVQFGMYADPVGQPTFTVESDRDGTIVGRFAAQVRPEAGAQGTSSGTFKLSLRKGWSGDAYKVLDEATLDVLIETNPPVSKS